MGYALFPLRYNKGAATYDVSKIALVVQEGTTDGTGLAQIWVPGITYPSLCSETYSTVIDRIGRALPATGVVYP